MPSLATDKNMSVNNKVNGYMRPLNNAIETNLTADGSKITAIQASISSLSSVILSSSSCGLNEGISSGSSIGVQIIEDSNVVETVNPNNRIKRSVETTRKKLIRIRQLRKSKSKKRKYRLINASKKQPASKKVIVKKQINEEFSSVFCLINDMIETVEKSLNEESTEKNMIKILLTDMWMLKSGQENTTNRRKPWKSPINSNSNYSRLTLLKARRNYEQFVKNSGENDNENENIIDNNEWDSSRIATNSFENDKIQIKSMRNSSSSSKNLNRQNDETIRKIDIHDEMTSHHHHHEIVEEATDSKTIVTKIDKENEQNCSKIVDLNPLGSNNNKMEKEESNNCTSKKNCNDEGTLNAGEEYLEKKFGRNELFTNNNKNNNQSYLKSNEFEYESESSCKTNSSLNNNELDCSLKMIQQQQQQRSNNDNTNNNNVFVENIFSSHSLINKIDKQSDSDFITPTNENENSNTIKEKKNNGDVILGNKDLNNNKFESTNNTVVLNDKSTNISNISTPSNNINNSYLKKKEEDLLYSLPTTSSLLSSSVLINLKQKNNEIEDILEEERKSSVDSDSKKTTIQIHSLNTTPTHYENNNHNEMIASKNNNSQPNTQTNKKKLKNEQEEKDEEDANQITNNNNINIPTYNNNSNINNNGCSISNNSNNNNHDDGVEILKDKCSDIMMNIENNNNNNKDEVVVEGNKTSRIGDNESLSSSSVSTNSSFNLNDNSTDEYNNLNQEFLGGNNTTNTKKNPTSISCIEAQNESGSNIKKVVLKNNEIVLIEDCTDDDDEDYLRLEKSKSQESAEIIPLSSSTENVMSRSYYSKSSQKSKKPIYSGEEESLVNNNNNNSEDPYVKAALERFDAFCKSKSTQNLDQNPTMTSPLLVNRQKSPYLSRKSANKPSEEQMNIGSFIKKRQARIDPKSQLTRNDSFDEAKPNSNRSISETRTESSQFRSLSSDKTRINKNIKPIDRSNEASTAQLTSSLAKKFLGSLTPQLEPVQINDVHFEEPFELIQQHISKQRDVATTLEKQPNIDSDNQESKAGLTDKKKLTSSKTIDLARTKPQSPSKPANNINNESEPKKNITLSSSASSTISSVSSASSDNSATSSPTHKANKPVNIIKLEVYNSKKQAKPNEQNSSGSGSNISKPPLPPTPTVNTNVSTATNPSSWRSKLRSIYSEAPIIDGSQKTNVTQPSNETATVTKVNSNKPISRVIPLEIKNKSTTNSNSNQQTNKQPVASNTITRGSSLYSSLKNIEKPTNTSSLPSNRSQSPPPVSSISTAQPTTNFTSSVQDRIRSLSISYRDENEHTNRLRDEYAKFNVEVNDASTVDNTHDPIAEKACSNFMHKLKEFQRQQSFQVYTPLSATTTSTSPITTVPTVSSYTGPIVSARTANTSPYIASSFANSVYSPVSTSYQPPSTYSSYSSSKYSTIGPSTVNSYLSSNDSSELSTSGSLTHRPYVSAIRKRRTLFSDELMSDESSNSSFSKTSSIFSQDSTFQDTTETIKPKIDNSKPNLDDSQSNKNGIGYSHARNRPLSIVNEEAAAAAAAANSNGLNRSLTFNESHLLKSYQNQTSRENTIRENEPTNQTPKPKIQIKKSNSVNSPNSKPEINKARSKLSNSEKDQTLSSSTFNVAASNVVNKTNNITPTKVNSNPQKPDTKKSTDRSSFEQPNISNIKLQNEIAIVTSMVPKKKDIPIPIPATINNNSDDNDACLNGQSINRIRSLDSKSREKYKSCIPNSNSTKKQQSSPNSSSNTTTNSIPITPIIQTNLIPSCYLYPKSSSTDNSNSNNSNSSKSSLSIGSEINTENIQNSEKGTVRRKSQVFLANGKLNNAESGNKADVFERLSKRTNSMKNLSNNQIKQNKNIGNSSDNEKTSSFSSNDEASTSQEYGLPQHNNHHNTSNSTANNLSKTSVFERLYKSNIAAHMNNHQNEINNTTEKNSLKKNMSVSSANLVSAVANQNINTTNSYISKNKTNGINFTKQRPKIGKISDEVDDNNSLENFEKCESSMKDNTTTNEEIDSNLIKKDPNFIKPSSSSFLSHKLMDLFNK